jgi:hypothetical protein
MAQKNLLFSVPRLPAFASCLKFHTLWMFTVSF